MAPSADGRCAPTMAWRGLAAAATGMMWPVRRRRGPLPGRGPWPWLVRRCRAAASARGVGRPGAARPRRRRRRRRAHRARPGPLDRPAGIALDAAGDLFVADTGHCRVLVVPARSRRSLRDAGAGRTRRHAGRRQLHGAGGFGHPSGVAVDAHGRRLRRRGHGAAGARGHAPAARAPSSRSPGTGTGRLQRRRPGRGRASSSTSPPAVAVDARRRPLHRRHGQLPGAGRCPRRRPRSSARPMAPGHLYTVAGTGVCGTSGQGGPPRRPQLWNPVAVTVDPTGDLLVADSGDQSVLLAADARRLVLRHGDRCRRHRRRRGRARGATGRTSPTGSRPTGPTAELNDPRGLAIGPSGALFVTDGFMHAIRVVPASTGTLLGRPMKAGDLYTAAGALPVTSAAGAGDGTRWVLTHMGTPVGRGRRAESGTLYFADASLDTVRAIAGGSGTSHEPLRPPHLPRPPSAGVAAGRVGVGRQRPAGAGRRRRRGGRSRSPRRRPRTRLRRPPGPIRAPAALTVNGLVDPVGVDPDGVPFAWTLHATGRAVMQSAYRMVVRRTDPGHAGTVWDSGPVPLGPAGLRRLRRAAAWPPTRPTSGRCVPAATPAMGSGVRTGPLHHRAARRRLAGAAGCDPAGELVATRPRDLPADRGDAACRAADARHRLRVGRAHLPPVRERRHRSTPGPASRIPTSSTPGPWTSPGSCAPGSPTRSACCTAGTAPGRAGPPRPPACSSSSRSGTPTARTSCYGSDGSWRELPAEWLPVAPAQRRRRRLRRVGRRARPAAGWAEPGFDDSAWSPAPVDRAGGHGAVHRARTPSGRPSGETPVPPGPPAHRRGRRASSPTSAPCTRPGPAVAFAHGRAGTDGHRCAPATCSTPTARSRPCTAPRRRTSRSSYIMRAGRPDLRGLHLLRLPLPPDRQRRASARPRTRSSPWPGTRPCRRCRRPRSRRTTGCSTRCGASRARSCLYCSQEQFVDTPTREKGQFIWDAANESEGIMRCLRRAEHELAGPARRGPRPGALLARRAGQRRLPQRRRRPRLRDVHARYPEWVWRYYLVHGRHRPPRVAHYTLGREGGRLAVVGPPGRHRAALRPGRHRATATPSTATTSRSRPTPPATSWPSTPSTGWPSWRRWPTTRAAPRSGRLGRRS